MSDMHAFLEIVAKGGAIVLCGYALWMTNRLLSRAKEPTKNELKLFWSVMATTIVVLSFAIYLDTFRIRFQEKESSFRDVVANLWFEPFRGKYPMGTLTGLEWECSTDATFNDFTGDYLVQRLWADASKPDCWIRATRVSSGLQVDFNRRGSGVDVTIPPRDNKPRLTGSRKWLRLELANQCEQPVAIRLRFVDERGTQWAWAFGRDETKQFGGEKTALDYRTKDGQDAELTIPQHNEKEFIFPLERKNWEVFPHDGNATMPSRAQNFKAVQFVVLELGRPDAQQPVEPEKHRRFMNDASNMSVLVKRILLE